MSEETIILCGGQRKSAEFAIGASISNAMTPINGKPIIGWILDDLLRKNITAVTVVLRAEDERFRCFLERAYKSRMQLKLARVSGEGTILHSLQAGLELSAGNSLARILLGDTLIVDSFNSSNDYVYIGPVEESRRWCLPVITEDDVIVEYLDKKNLPGGPFKALAGYYHLQHADVVRKCVLEAIAAGKRELSDVLALYGEQYPIKTREVTEWYDFGHIDNVIDARRRLLRPRHFNSLTVNPVLNTITKVSERNEKLQDELHWYLNLPDELKVLTPRIIKHEQTNGHLEIVQEYYGYPTLAELYVYSDIDVDTWASILSKVLRTHREFLRYPGTIGSEELRAVYLDKTWSRLDNLQRTDAQWRARLECSEVRWNGQALRPLSELREPIEKHVDRLIVNAPVAIIHGDFCFSNILFDLNNQILRLIDPRGSFGGKGMFGDVRYDIAKLRHSVSGLYDFIIADMFDVHEKGNEFTSEVYAVESVPQVAKKFDVLLERHGYDLRDIQFLEGLLFISMLPLHADSPRRQLMMYLTGLSLLNEVLS